MTDKTTTCPLNGGDHRYFIFKVQEVFEPVKENIPEGIYLNTQYLKFVTNLYEKNEYAILGCNCGSVIRQKVVSHDQ